jgi:hypothetical protein
MTVWNGRWIGGRRRKLKKKKDTCDILDCFGRKIFLFFIYVRYVQIYCSELWFVLAFLQHFAPHFSDDIWAPCIA